MISKKKTFQGKREVRTQLCKKKILEIGEGSNLSRSEQKREILGFSRIELTTFESKKLKNKKLEIGEDRTRNHRNKQ